jgi:DedD protein
MKQRLVGAIVLGCLSIIFIPILLDGEGVRSPETRSNIPTPSAIPVVPAFEPVRPIVLADTEEINIPVPELEIDNSEARVSFEENLPDEIPQLSTTGIPKSWSVRLASFGDAGNAEALLNRLLQNGYKAYSRLLDSSQGVLTAVYIGPVLTTAEADTLQEELEKEFELSGIVVEFTIEELVIQN